MSALNYRNFAVLAFALLARSLSAGTETPMDAQSSWVSHYQVGTRYGEYLLIRKGSSLCALKFVAAWRGNNKKAATFWNSGDESFRAEYKWLFVNLDKNPWAPTEAMLKSSEVSRGETIGPGKFGTSKGQNEVKCGSIHLGWLPPSSVSFAGKAQGYQFGDFGYEMALTNTTSIELIDPQSPAITWYRYDGNRAALIHPQAPAFK